MKAECGIIEAIKNLPEEGDIIEEVKETLAKLVCTAYCPRGISIPSIPDLRQNLFCKHIAESNNLPPTLGALEKHIKCVQSRVWCQASVMQKHHLIPWSMATITTTTVGYYLSLQRIFMCHSQSSSWSDVNAEPIVHLSDVHA